MAGKIAFGNNFSLQPKAAVVFGALFREGATWNDVYHVLLSLRVATSRFQVNDDVLPLNGTIMCLSNILRATSSLDTHTVKSIFWIGSSLLQIGSDIVLPNAVSLMYTILQLLDNLKIRGDQHIHDTLMATRKSMQSSLNSLETSVGVSFDTDFSFAIAVTLARGLRIASVKSSTASLLLTFLKIASKEHIGSTLELSAQINAAIVGYVTLLLPFAVSDGTIDTLLRAIKLDVSISDFGRSVNELDLSNNAIYKYAGLESLFSRFDIGNKPAIIVLTLTLTAAILQNSDKDIEQVFLCRFLGESFRVLSEDYMFL